MEDHENLYEKIREILGGSPGKLKILEQRIDMDLQMEYYECSKRLRNEMEEGWALENVHCLRDKGSSDEIKKNVLARLATVEKVECYRAIESYLTEADESLRDWALLALNESRIFLEGELLQENQVFISTGLGGKEQKLRYFVVLVTRDKSSLTGSQQMVIRNEFSFLARKYDAELEEIRFSDYLATVLLLLPMNHSLKVVFGDAIAECNQYGDFLNEDFIVTNVKTLSFEEIREFIERDPRKEP